MTDKKNNNVESKVESKEVLSERDIIKLQNLQELNYEIVDNKIKISDIIMTIDNLNKELILLKENTLNKINELKEKDDKLKLEFQKTYGNIKIDNDFNIIRDDIK